MNCSLSIGAFPRYHLANTIRRRKSSEDSNSPFGDPFAQAFNHNAPMTPAPAAAAANSNQDQYPYPTSNSNSVVENHGPAVPPTSLLIAGTNNGGAPQETSNGMGGIVSQTGPGLQSGPAQTTSSSSTSSFSSSSTSTSSSSTSLPSKTTLIVLSSTQVHRGPADAQSPVFLSQTFADTYSSSPSDTQPSPTSTAPTNPLHLSATAVGLLLSLAGFIFLIVSICLIRCIRRQIRNHQRRLHKRVFDFAGSAEKGGAWGSDDDERTINNSSSPSTIFGGKERTGLTPLPSWTAFPEGNANGSVAPSPYPLGLVPPPTVVHQASSPLHAQNGVGLGFFNKSSGLPLRPQGFSPPTITVTTSSPRSSGTLFVPHQGLISSSSSGMSTCGSFNRVSVYDHPEHGAQLVRPPKLAVVNDNINQEARYSGWSSWDDSVGVELGVKMDRKHPVQPGQKSRRPHGRGGRISALKSTLAPVPEASDSSSVMERHDGPPARLDPVHHRRKNGNSPSRLHPNGPASGNHHHQHQQHSSSSPVSPLSIRSSPSKSLRSPSPRSPSKPTPNSLLYDLPQFDNLSPTVGGISRTNSSNSDSDYQQQRSNTGSQYRPQRRSGGKLKRRSHTRNSRQRGTSLPSPTVSEALSETYAYVYSYGGSDDDKEEVIRVHRRSKRASVGGTRKKNSSPRSGTSHSPILRVNKEVVAASPGVHASVGALMLAAYEEEELLNGSSSSPSSRKLEDKQKERKAVLEDSTNIDKGSVMGLGVRVEKGKVAYSTSGPSSQHQYDRRQGGDEDSKGRITQVQVQAHSHYDQRGVPAHLLSRPHAVPEPEMPNLSVQEQQMRNVAEWPDYRRSPTYSVYGMYYGTMPRSPLDGTAEYL